MGQITGNNWEYGSGDRNINVWAGQYTMVVSPFMDSTAYIIMAANETHKPMIVAMKEQPHLLASWFDPEANEGGMYYWKFFARYRVYYGDWRLAYQGNT